VWHHHKLHQIHSVVAVINLAHSAASDYKSSQTAGADGDHKQDCDISQAEKTNFQDQERESMRNPGMQCFKFIMQL
jgi:hypothetical protein